MAGRKRIPTKLKIIRGTDQKCRMNPDEPEPEIELPKPPKHLTGIAAKEWKRAGALLEELGLISDIDMCMFLAYCESYGRWREAEKKIKEQGLFIEVPIGIKKGKKGKEDTIIFAVKKNPYLAIAKDAKREATKYAVEFGMSPASRSKVKAEKGNQGKGKKTGFGDL